MNRLKKIISLCLVITIIFLICNISNAEVKIPSVLRVGLYYSDASLGASSAVSCFTVNAQKGLQLGFNNNNSFNLLFEEKSNKSVTIRKDSYFSKSNGSFREYDPLSAAIPDGDRIGPYHIQIGANFKDFNAVSKQISVLKELGVQAYAVYVDHWQVWTGFYTDSNTAQNDLNIKIKSKLSSKFDLSIIKPAANRIVALLSSGEVALIFGSDSNKLLIHPKKENNPNILKINSKNNYRGDLEIRRFASSDMTIINIVKLDQYLYGVVPPEIGEGAQPEALKAQAVAAKNYALSSEDNHNNLGFDLCSTTHCQVYKGYDVEKPESNKAIDAVTGKILTYKGELVTTFYFSSDGGVTEDAKNVLGSDIPYLVSVEDKYESEKSDNYNWVVSKTSNSIKQTLQSRSSDIGDILSIQITKTSETGRTMELIITGSKGSKSYTKSSTRTVLGLSSQMYKISTDSDTYFYGAKGVKLKAQLGSKKVITSKGLKSSKILNNSIIVIGAKGIKKAIPIIPSKYTFTGKGSGHAVGMSQEGAIGMAKEGFTYEQILKHYYTGTEIE